MSEGLPRNNKTFDDVMTLTFLMTSSCILGSVRVEESRKPDLRGFHPICLEFGIGGNFDTLITKRKPKLKS